MYYGFECLNFLISFNESDRTGGSLGECETGAYGDGRYERLGSDAVRVAACGNTIVICSKTTDADN